METEESSSSVEILNNSGLFCRGNNYKLYHQEIFASKANKICSCHHLTQLKG